MNSSFSVKNWTCYPALTAILLAELLVPLPTLSAQEGFQARANDLSAKFHSQIVRDSSGTYEKISKEIVALQGEAAELDKLQAQQAVIDSMEMDYKNAQAAASGLDDKFGNDRDVANSTVNSLLQQMRGICRQMGGSWQMGGSGQDNSNAPCRFDVSCSSDHPEVCTNEANRIKGQFDPQVQPLISQIRSISIQLDSEKEQLDKAKQTAADKEQQWENKKSQYAEDKAGSGSRKDEFEREASQIENEINNSTQTPGAKLGRAWQDLVNVFSSQKHYDSPLPDVAMPLSARVPDPPATAQSPAYIEATKAVEETARRREAARSALADAQRDHADPQTQQRLLKVSTDADMAYVTAQYNRKSALPVTKFVLK